MAKNSFAGRVLAAISSNFPAAGGRPPAFRAADLVAPLHIQTQAEKKRLSGVLNDLFRAGKIARVGTGAYALHRSELRHGPAAAVTARPEPSIYEKMWAILRSRGTVTVADLMELTGASAGYAKEALRLWVKREAVKALPQPGNQPHRYQLVVRDLVEAPSDVEKASRLAELRLQKHRSEIRQKHQGMHVQLQLLAEGNLTQARQIERLRLMLGERSDA